MICSLTRLRHGRSWIACFLRTSAPSLWDKSWLCEEHGVLPPRGLCVSTRGVPLISQLVPMHSGAVERARNKGQWHCSRKLLTSTFLMRHNCSYWKTRWTFSRHVGLAKSETAGVGQIPYSFLQTVTTRKVPPHNLSRWAPDPCCPATRIITSSTTTCPSTVHTREPVLVQQSRDGTSFSPFVVPFFRPANNQHCQRRLDAVSQNALFSDFLS